MAEVILTVKNGTGDYTSISAFESGEQSGTWATDGDTPVAECYDEWASGLSDRVYFNGWSDVDATYYPVVRSAPGEGHAGDPTTGFRIVSSSDSCFLPWMKVDIEEIRMVAGTAAAINCNNASADVRVYKCFITGGSMAASAAGGITAVTSGGVCYARSTIVYDTNGRGYYGLTSADLLIAQNCVADGCSDIGFLRTKTTNCVSIGHTLGDFFDLRTGSDYTASEDTSATGTNQYDSITLADEFTDYANNDYSIDTANSDALLDNGSDLSGTFTQDITGTTWSSTWDIGAFSGAASSGTTIIADFISSGTIIYQPTLAGTDVTINADFISSGTIIYQPTLAGTDATINADFISSGTIFYQPTIVAGLTIVADFISSSTALYQPTLGGGPATISADFITSSAVLYQPTLSVPGGAQTISSDFIMSGTQIFQPSVSGTGWTEIQPLMTVWSEVLGISTNWTEI